MAEKFEVTYLVEDGYVGDSPQRFKISEYDLEAGMDPDDLEALLDEMVQTDFEQRITPPLCERTATMGISGVGEG